MEFFFPVDPLDDVRRLYRQACLHRLAHDEGAAARILNHDLPALVARLRAGDDGYRWTDEALRAACADEYRRVLDAQVIGDFVLRRLQGTSADSAAPFVAVAPVAVPDEPAPPPRERPAGPQSITDMLDSMLAQDRPRRARAS